MTPRPDKCTACDEPGKICANCHMCPKCALLSIEEGEGFCAFCVGDVVGLLLDMRRKVKAKLESIVCTEGCDKGVVMVDHESPTYYDPAVSCHVYKYEHFSPLGDALIELWDLLRE